MTIKGFQSQRKTGKQQYATLQNLGSERFGIEALTRALTAQSALAIAATADATDLYTVISTAHGARIGDFIKFTTGSNIHLEAPVVEIVDADTIKVAIELNAICVTGDEFFIMRPNTLSVDSDGNLTTSSGPLLYVKDGSDQVVTRDTATPSNNAPLPVEIIGAAGQNINITAGDINVQLSHLGASFDSTRVGDGTNLLGINGDFEALVHDQQVQDKLDTLNGNDFATQTTLAAILAKIIAAPSTEAKQDNIITALGLRATEVTLAALSAKFSSLGQKVSASSAPIVLSTEQEAILQAISDNQLKDLDTVAKSYKDYSSCNVVNGAYNEAITLSVDVKKVRIFHANGEVLALAVGAAASEVDKVYIYPGMDAEVYFDYPAGTRVSVTKLTAGTVSSGILVMNFMG